jgi:3-oxoacyl-[acyl-carrier-protein] synthase III
LRVLPDDISCVPDGCREAGNEISMPMTDQQVKDRQLNSAQHSSVFLAGSGFVTGSRILASEEVDRAFGMPIGKLRSRAGIESVAYAADGETERTLGTQAAQEALQATGCSAEEIDSIVATSETHHVYPSLAAQLHSSIGARESCGAFDVGGACLGLVNALAVAQSMIVSGQARTVAVVTADVHSRTLVPGRVAGEFGGLFGDGASAFLLRNAEPKTGSLGYRLREFLFGCAGQYSEAVKVEDRANGTLDVVFDGEALSRAAITRMEKVVSALEKLSAIPRSAVGAFATHQPNPRLLSLLAKVSGVPVETFPPIARTAGNLGSSTCGAALHAALQMFSTCPLAARKPIFLASLGPGLLFGGAWLVAES